jgi:hypothetical protein
VRAVYVNWRGKHQVRFVCTGLHAGARENRQELDTLRKLRGGEALPR